jgi:hypothetical protein
MKGPRGTMVGDTDRGRTQASPPVGGDTSWSCCVLVLRLNTGLRLQVMTSNTLRSSSRVPRPPSKFAAQHLMGKEEEEEEEQGTVRGVVLRAR